MEIKNYSAKEESIFQKKLLSDFKPKMNVNFWAIV